MGPTAVGKTPLAIELAQKCNAEIICVDSIAVYREFNIGVAKPSHVQREMALHHLIDIVDPIEPFSAGDFCKRATDAMRDIEKRGKNVLLVGGSGLYFRAFFNGMFEIPERDLKIKESLEEKLIKNGIAYLYNELKDCDPETALVIHPNDSYRIVRGLEVYYTTGRRFSEYRKEHQTSHLKSERFEMLKIGLDLPRSELHQNISMRTEKILNEGLLEEVSYLMKKYPLNCKPFQSVGYKEAVSFLQKETAAKKASSFFQNELATEINQKTRALARRQLTWFRREPDIRWFEPDESRKIEQAIKDFLAI
ncbi:MAG: tRNA (adenosine(37)-N6)-dimethylallyltransferase MiaA [Deltaproteobacteria bacterium]